MLVCPQVINDATTLLAIDHVCVESSSLVGRKGAYPGHRLATQGIAVRVILYREWNIPAMLREHDASPRSHVKKRKSIGRSMPDLFHHACAYRRGPVSGTQRKAPLNLWMQFGEITSECSLID